MNTLSRTATRMTLRALAVPVRSISSDTAIPLPPPKHKKDKLKKEETKQEPIEKVPKHTQPGSKYALKNEDFADEANYERFANEPQKDKNPAWPR